MKCKHCESQRVISRGPRRSKIRMQCMDCKKYFSVERSEVRILMLDIETLYMEVRGVWALKNNNYIQPDRIIKDWSVLCYAAKWLFQPDVMGKSVTSEEAVNRDEKSIIEDVWRLLDDAQIIITQNGINFDLKKLNVKFLKHGLPPPSKFLNIDTKVTASKVFGFPSNKLDYLVKEVLGLDGKIPMRIKDWDACAEGNQEALDKMLFYCKNDIAPLLEDLYLKFRPWIPNHPNLNLFTGDKVDKCPRCLGELDIDGSEYPTPQGLWVGYRCKKCGGIGRMSNKIKTTTIKV